MLELEKLTSKYIHIRRYKFHRMGLLDEVV